MIALLGATGYTGRLVAKELARRRLPHRRGGRDARRLATLPAVPDAEPFVVDIAEPSRLDAFLEGATALVNTAGPFTRLGLPVVEAAVRNRVPYVDCTGEPAFVREVYERFAGAEVPVVPACGLSTLPADLAAAVAAADLGPPVHELVTHQRAVTALPSRGTVRTALEMLPAAGLGRTRRVAFPDRVRTAVELPGTEVVLARHAREARVASTAVISPLVVPVLARALPLVRWLQPLTELLPAGPPEPLRRAGRGEVLAEAIGPAGRRAVFGQARDPYGITARLLVEAALAVRGQGPLAPAQALDAEPFLDAMAAGSDFSWRRLP